MPRPGIHLVGTAAADGQYRDNLVAVEVGGLHFQAMPPNLVFGLPAVESVVVVYERFVEFEPSRREVFEEQGRPWK